MSRFKPLGFALLLLLTAQPRAAAQQTQDAPRPIDKPDYRYQDRGDRWEGTVAPSEHKDTANPVALLSLTAYDEKEYRDMPESYLSFAFFLPELPRPLDVYPTIQTLSAEPTYQVSFNPFLRWRAQSYNHVAWQTGLARQYGFRGAEKLGFVVELAPRTAASPRTTVVAAPVTLYQANFPDRINTYSFSLKKKDPFVVFRLYRLGDLGDFFTWSGDELVRVPGSPYPLKQETALPLVQTHTGEVETLLWKKADESPDGWYYLAAENSYSRDVSYGVLFFHQSRTYTDEDEKYYLPLFKRSLGQALDTFRARRARLEVIEVPQPEGIRPVSYPGRPAADVLAYRAEELFEVLRACRKPLKWFFSVGVFAGIGDYLESEYPTPSFRSNSERGYLSPSSEEIPTFLDPRDARRRLVEKSVGDKVLSKAQTVLNTLRAIDTATVEVDVSSVPTDAKVSLITFKGKTEATVITNGKILYLRRATYIVRATKPGFQDFKTTMDFVQTGNKTAIGCEFYAADDSRHMSRCNNPK